MSWLLLYEHLYCIWKKHFWKPSIKLSLVRPYHFSIHFRIYPLQTIYYEGRANLDLQTITKNRGGIFALLLIKTEQSLAQETLSCSRKEVVLATRVTPAVICQTPLYQFSSAFFSTSLIVHSLYLFLADNNDNINNNNNKNCHTMD